ncbi:MAG: electron transfer flavoprotein subunit beta/FixA family protein [Chloroflexi bacterium]|nr:electron transfer flavoprotein subunit beta/FixA family protein [Chloroflexota bacterium]
MKIVVPVNLAPDLVEELTIDEDGTRLDMEWMSLILNEFDDHAIEQAILLKEKIGGTVIIVAPELEGADDALFAALTKGADQVVKLAGTFDEGANKHALARAFTATIRDMQPDLILTGVQAHDDLDGSFGPLLAEYLDMPYVGYIAGINLNNGSTSVRKEYPGGLIAEMNVKLPAVLGIQAAEQPPRYVAFSKVRQAMKSASIKELELEDLDFTGAVSVSRMFEPETGEHAQMLEGDEEEIAAKLVEILKAQDVL